MKRFNEKKLRRQERMQQSGRGQSGKCTDWPCFQFIQPFNTFSISTLFLLLLLSIVHFPRVCRSLQFSAPSQSRPYGHNFIARFFLSRSIVYLLLAHQLLCLGGLFLVIISQFIPCCLRKDLQPDTLKGADSLLLHTLTYPLILRDQITTCAIKIGE